MEKNMTEISTASDLVSELDSLVVVTMSSVTTGRGKAASSCCCSSSCCCCSSGGSNQSLSDLAELSPDP